MAKYIAPIQPLILTVAGVKPTIPEPSTIMPTDSRFDKQSNLMVGQLAYNIVDDIWYYRSGSAIKKLTGQTELTIEEVEVWRDDKVYNAGNTFVSYVNESSSDPDFQEASIYRCVTTTNAGESPESHETKWERQGTTVDNSSINFLDLQDTPASYDGLAGKFVAITDDETGLKFVDPPESETITLDTVEVYDDTKSYTAGNTFVSYVNTGSSDPQFQEEAIYRCDVDTNVGESPESHPDKWVYQGTQVEVSSGNTSNTAVADLNTLKALTGYKNTDSLFVSSEQAWYKFDVNDDTGTRANDYDAVDNPGSWKILYQTTGGLASTWEADITVIKAITDYSDGIDVGNYATGIIYEFDATSTLADDGVNVLKPDNILSADPGRWINKIDFKQFTASFSFTGRESFKQVFGRNLSITSATIAPGITDLRVGKNGATPATIAFPFSIASADVIEFAATYDRESDSYFTLIGKEV